MQRMQTLSEPTAKELLSNEGIQIPRFETVGTADEAAEAAESIGYPVVVKVVSPTISHKSDWGDGVGVALNCHTPATVSTAAEDILAAGSERDIEVALLVEEALPIENGVETLVSGFRDPTFGPVVGFGIGGRTVELLNDMAYRLAPLEEEQALALIQEPRLSPLLDGYRGGPHVDRSAVATALRKVGDLLAKDDEILELEINPLLATAEASIALDALVTRTDD